MNFKVPYSIRKSLIKILPFMATAIMATSCHKELYDVVINWNWKDNLGYAPPKEMIRNEINKKNVNTVFINLTSPNSTGYALRDFSDARDSLQTRLDIAPGRVRGMGTIYVNSNNGAHLPDTTYYGTCGMALEDSLWFATNGWKIQRWQPSNNK